MNKITVIGSGSVGATISYTLTVMGLASEIVLIDINQGKAIGEAMDIEQGVPFFSATTISAGTYEDAANSDIVVIASGVARKPGQSRLDLAQTNVNILKSVAKEIVKHAPNAIYILVSNPVDILTYVFCKTTGISETRVIGSGTILDTARLRSKIAEHFSINSSNVHAFVLGEHGDSAVVPWSVANISNVCVEGYKDAALNGMVYDQLNKEDAEEYVRKSGARIIQNKGATYYAVSMSVCHLCRCLLRGIDTTLTVSTMMHGEYGIEDVCMSLLTVIGNKGVHGKILLPMNEDEISALHRSADSLKNVIKSIEI